MTTRVRVRMVFLRWALLLVAVHVQAAVPSVVSVQGELGQITGGVATNVTGTSKEMTLRIYAATNSPTALFGRTKVPVLLEQGRFAAEIGNGAGLTNALAGATYSSFIDMISDATNNVFYLGLQPTGLATNMFPLMRLQSTPFALVAGDVKQATRTFDVLDGTATLGTLIVQGAADLKGPVTFDAASAPVFLQPTTIAGDVNVTGGTTTLSALTVEGSSVISNAALNSVNVSGNTTVNGSLAVAAGMTTVTGEVTMAAAKVLTVTNSLTVSGKLTASTFQAINVKVTPAFTLPSTAKVKQIFGERKCISLPTNVVPISDSDWSNMFYQVTTTADAGTSYGYWKAPQDCFISANFVVGRYDNGEQRNKPISVKSTAPAAIHDKGDYFVTDDYIALTYHRYDVTGSYAAHKGNLCILMKKGTYLCWYSDYDNQDTVFGQGYMREISVLYFAK